MSELTPIELEELEAEPKDTLSIIEERAAGNMSETFNVLRKSRLYGTHFMHAKRDFVKFRLFGTVCAPDDEGIFYNPIVLEYSGKVLALQLINPGMDYWGNQEISVNTKGVEESITFPDRVKMLLQLQERLWTEIRELLPLVEETISITPISRAGAKVSPSGSDKTPNPQDFPAAYGEELAFPEETGSWE